MFTKLKAALATFFNRGETEIHAVVDAAVQDAAPLLDTFRTTLLADVEKLLADAKLDEGKLASVVAAEVAKVISSTPAAS